MNLWLLGLRGKGGVRDRLGVWDWHVHTAIFKIENQQGPTVWYRELCSILCNNLNGQRIDTRVCITESLCCTPETKHCESTILQYKIKMFLKSSFSCMSLPIPGMVRLLNFRYSKTCLVISHCSFIFISLMNND